MSQDNRIRTYNLLVRNQLRFQLRHVPFCRVRPLSPRRNSEAHGPFLRSKCSLLAVRGSLCGIKNRPARSNFPGGALVAYLHTSRAPLGRWGLEQIGWTAEEIHGGTLF